MALKGEFTSALWGTVEAARERGFVPVRFMQMLQEHGGLETARRLLAQKEPQEGLFRLWELDLLGESMEAVVLQERFKALFTREEIEEARRRLEELGYFRGRA